MPLKTQIPYDVRAKEWGKRLWTVVDSETKYNECHDDLFEEYKKLHGEATALGNNTYSMVNHAAPVYEHIASHGYKSHIHRKALIAAVGNFCENRPVVQWEGPPDQFSRSPSSRRSPSPPLQPLLASKNKEFPRTTAAGSVKKNAKAVNPVIEESENESVKPVEDESAKPRKAEAKSGETKSGEAKSLPSTEGMELSPIKCTPCEPRGHGCHVNPKATKAAAACFECNHWRIKCSLAPTRTNAKKGEDEDELAPTKEPAPKRRYYKKPTQIPAGQPGQFSGELTLLFADIN
jgi:hypothetical protein